MELDRTALARYFSGEPTARAFVRLASDSTARFSTIPSRLTLASTEILGMRVRDSVVADTTAGRAHGDLPWEFLGLDDTGDPRVFALAFEVQGGGLRYSAGAGPFQGSVLIGVEERGVSSTRGALPQPIMVLITGNVDAVEPTHIEISRIGLPFESARLTALAPQESVRVHLRPDFDADGVDLHVPVVRSALSVEVTPVMINGFGLEAATVLVGLPPGTDNRSVAVTVDRGNLRSTLLNVTGGGAATTALWSRGVGSGAVTAKSPPLADAGRRVIYVFPWMFLAAVLVGGFLGGLGREMVARKSGRERLGLVSAIYVVSGVLGGFVAGVAYAIGIRIFQVDLPTQAGEAAVFLAGVVGGYRGLPGVARLVDRHTSQKPA